jgi:hypothetical protein
MQEWLPSQVDARTFGGQLARLLDDLNRPDLQAIGTQYLQDAMRYYARQAFFFNDVDNSTVPPWAASTLFTQGATIQVPISGTTYVFVALQTGTQLSDATPPAWPTALFVSPGGFPPPTLPYTGAVADNNVIWGNLGVYQTGIWTQLSTVYAINQYVVPIDYVSPELIEVTAANLRYELQRLSYRELRSYDVIRPAPGTVYPTYWAWFQQQIYLWPYPGGFYPLTLSYRAAPMVATDAATTNFWTTTAEKLIRKYAQGSIELEVLKDAQAAEMSFKAAQDELRSLRSQRNAQAAGGVQGDPW